jgi:hypothetical protein
VGERGSKLLEKHVHKYFKHINDECLAAPSMRDMDLEDWTDTERLDSKVRVGEAALLSAVFLMFFAWPMIYLYQYRGFAVASVVVTGLPLLVLVVGVLAVIHDAVVRYNREGSGPRPFLREWPAEVKRFDVSMTDCVTRLSRALSDHSVKVRIFSVVLHDRRGEPHGVVFITKWSLMRITVWKDWDDPDHTVVHIGPTNTRRGKVIGLLKDIVDGATIP